MEAIILLGAPGAGKGTVADDLKASTALIHLSTGDMLRAAVKAGRPLGLEARGYMERGELVPDNLVMRIVRERLDEGGPADCFMFDGYPRNASQAQMLDQVMREKGGRITHVFLLEVPREVLVMRISGRRICRQCGSVYHIKNIPSRVAGVCDKCGGELYQRSDDNEATVINRLEVFQTSTQPLIEYYQRQGVLCRINAEDRATLLRDILGVLGRRT
jgi:adenylate kinase